MALQLRRVKNDLSDCCQMAIQRTLWSAKRYPSTVISVFITGFPYFSFQVTTLLLSRDWVEPVLDPMAYMPTSRKIS